MNPAKLCLAIWTPSEVDFLPTTSLLSVCVIAPPTAQPSGVSGAPVSESWLAELFAAKRAEKPPENFLPEFLEEFHRRNPLC